MTTLKTLTTLIALPKLPKLSPARPFSPIPTNAHTSAAALAIVLTAALAVGVLAPTAPAHAADADERQAATHWNDFNHYVVIRRPELAQAAGELLLEVVGDNDELLVRVVEQGDHPNYQRNFTTAQNIDDLRQTARAVERRVQQARVNLARDEQRIARDIERLGEGQRPFRNAVERLTGAGQFAVPQMLAALEDPAQRELHPLIVSALVQMGQPVVYPLAEALPHLEPALQGQLAQVLARIGYSLPLPYIKDVLERGELDSHARDRIERAYAQLLGQSDAGRDLAAAELYLNLATRHYNAATRGERAPGYDPQQELGIVWQYQQDVGLIDIRVPAQIHGDVLAMRASRRALELERDMDAALSRWLVANLRRENNLGADELDPSYDRGLEPPSFYAMIAGPRRLHDVLAQAVRDRDARLALDAIGALTHTAGTEALVAMDAGRQPLLEALAFPDTRVRFHAAQTLARARPTEDFPEAHRVVPILAEAVRGDGTRHAMVLARDQATLNRRLAEVAELGYEPFGALTFSRAQNELRRRPGVDVVLVDMSAGSAVGAYRDVVAEHRLGSAPVVVIAAEPEQYRVRQDLARTARLFMVAPPESQEPESPGEEPDVSWLAGALEEAAAAHAGESIDADEAREFALAALASLREIAVTSAVYRARDALPALIEALRDERREIAESAAEVLALIDHADAQRSLARLALDDDHELQVVMLGHLGDSATRFGNMLARRHVDRLLRMVRTSTGEKALGAARAHGALALPTANAVGLILGDE